MFDILFKNASIITMCDENRVIENGFVGIKGKMIDYVSDSEPEEDAKRVIDCKNKILMPGLINTHAHTAMCLMRGYADDYALNEWLFDKVFPVEARLDKRSILAGARLGYAEMIKSGTTSISDMYFFEPDCADVVINCGLRASLCNGIIGFDAKTFDFKNDRSITETLELIKNYNGAGDGRVKANVSIHAEYTTVPEIWEFARDLAVKNNVPMQIHMSETKKEHDECIKRNGKTPARVFYDYGVFDVRTTCAHCVWISEDDMDIMAEKGVTCAHNPISNLKLASGIAPIEKMIEKGVNVSLGTDGCCSNNNHDLFEEMKMSLLLQKGTMLDPTIMPAYEALKMATVNGAYAQGRECEVGRIKEGMEADIILIDCDKPKLQPIYDKIAAVAYSANGSDVCFTMVQGRILYENYELKTIDYKAAVEEVNCYAKNIVLNK